jgi:hypothetical protein
LQAMEHDGWVPHIFDLGDHGVSDMDDEGPSRDAGSISTEVKWVPLLDNGKCVLLAQYTLAVFSHTALVRSSM